MFETSQVNFSIQLLALNVSNRAVDLKGFANKSTNYYPQKRIAYISLLLKKRARTYFLLPHKYVRDSRFLSSQTMRMIKNYRWYLVMTRNEYHERN